jgi:Cu/Ag efflux pump CusA
MTVSRIVPPLSFGRRGGLFVATMLTLLVRPVFYITLSRAHIDVSVLQKEASRRSVDLR